MNLSQDSSSLKIIKYTRDQDAQAPGDFFKTNVDMVRFFHPESDSFMGASCDLLKEVSFQSCNPPQDMRTPH
jgi:hypothetical protein